MNTLREPTMFLEDHELVQLTGRKMKSQQIAWLRTSGIPFRVNATGHPVVTRSAVEGQQSKTEARGWTPRVVGT